MRFFACSVLFSQCAWGPTPTRSRSATSRLARAAGAADSTAGNNPLDRSTADSASCANRELRTAIREINSLPTPRRSAAAAAAAAKSAKPAPATAAESATTKATESTAEAAAETTAEWADAAVPSAPRTSAPSSTPWSRAAVNDHDDQEDDGGN